MNYEHLFRLTKEDLLIIISRIYPHLANSLYKASKRDIIGELKNRETFG